MIEPEVIGKNTGLTQDFLVGEVGKVGDESFDLVIDCFVLSVSANLILAVSPEMIEGIQLR